jgi:hypothetical protein
VFDLEHTYRLLGSEFLVRFTEPAQEKWVHPVLAHLTQSTGVADVTIDVVAIGGDRHLVCRDRRAVQPTAIDGLAPLVKGLVWQDAVNRSEFFVSIHAGVVGTGEACALLPAPAGSGKSILTAALAHAGLIYFSDEVALLKDGSLDVLSMPLSIGVKSTGWDLLEPYFPEIRRLPSHRRLDGTIVRYLPPPSVKYQASDRSCPVRWLIFPQYAEKKPTKLRPLSRADSLRRLMAECVVMPVPLNYARVASLISWMKSVDCFELQVSSLDRAVELVLETLSKPHNNY